MKKIYLFLLLSAFHFHLAQTKDLTKLSAGEYLHYNALFDENNNITGYAVLYNNTPKGDDIEEDSIKTKKFEYFLLNTNLEVTAKKEFEAEKFIRDYYPYTSLKKNIILEPLLETNYLSIAGGATKFVYPLDKEINPLTNTLVDITDKCFKNETIVDCPRKTSRENRKEYREEKSENGFVVRSLVVETRLGNYAVFQYELHTTGGSYYTRNNNVYLFSKEGKQLWKYQYNQDSKFSHQVYLENLYFDENRFFCLLEKRDFNKTSYTVLVLDMKTGAVLKETPLDALLPRKENMKFKFDLGNYMPIMEGSVNEKSISSKKVIGDKINIIGNYIQSSAFKPDSIYGYIQLQIDMKSLNVKINNFDLPNDFSPFVHQNVNENGHLEDGERSFFLDPTKLFFNEDNSFDILTEARSISFTHLAKDFFLISTDNNFKITKVKDFKQGEEFLQAEYLFSQQKKDKKGFVFFYSNKSKGQNRNNKEEVFIYNLQDHNANELKKIDITKTKDKTTIGVGIAKEGYFLLHKYNEKLKINQISLEKITD